MLKDPDGFTGGMDVYFEREVFKGNGKVLVLSKWWCYLLERKSTSEDSWTWLRRYQQLFFGYLNFVMATRHIRKTF